MTRDRKVPRLLHGITMDLDFNGFAAETPDVKRSSSKQELVSYSIEELLLIAPIYLGIGFLISVIISMTL